jgi:outer membrane protein
MSRNYLAMAIALIVLGLQPVGVSAQKKPLSLEAAVAAGIEASPALHASRMKVESSAAKSREAAAGRLPALKLGGGYARLSEVPPFSVTLPFLPNPIVVSENYFDSLSLRLGIQQPLFTGFRLQAGEASARLLEQSAGQDLEKDRAEFVFGVKSAYWGLARARALETVIDENIRQVGEHLKDVRAFFDQGMATKNDILRAELELSNEKLVRIDARNAAEIALTTLNSLIGWPLDTDVELTTSPGDVPQGGDASGGGERPQRADIKSADFRIRAYEMGVKAARSGYYPQVHLFGNYFYLRPNPRYMPALDKFRGTWDLGVSVSFDLWDWGKTKSQAEQARAQLDQARDARQLLEDQAVLEIAQSELSLNRAGEKIEVAALTVAQAEENLRVTRERFKQGVALSADVLDADVALLRAKVSRTQSEIDLELARARLEKALGY